MSSDLSEIEHSMAILSERVVTTDPRRLYAASTGRESQDKKTFGTQLDEANEPDTAFAHPQQCTDIVDQPSSADWLADTVEVQFPCASFAITMSRKSSEAHQKVYGISDAENENDTCHIEAASDKSKANSNDEVLQLCAAAAAATASQVVENNSYEVDGCQVAGLPGNKLIGTLLTSQNKSKLAEQNEVAIEIAQGSADDHMVGDCHQQDGWSLFPVFKN